MRALLLVLSLAALCGACACPQPKKGDGDPIPGTMKPRSSSRDAGLGKGAIFVK